MTEINTRAIATELMLEAARSVPLVEIFNRLGVDAADRDRLQEEIDRLIAEADVTVTLPDAGHAYLSTACWHATHDGDEQMHTACRNVCKYCDQPCACPNHPARDGDDTFVSWVDQARDIARELLAAIQASELPQVLAPEQWHRIEDDPALFWLRGEEAPAGTWRPEGDSDAR